MKTNGLVITDEEYEQIVAYLSGSSSRTRLLAAPLALASDASFDAALRLGGGYTDRSS